MRRQNATIPGSCLGADDESTGSGLFHEGYCDWQFYSLLDRGSTVNFNDLPVTFDPIIEVVSSFKLIIKQSNLFELKVGDGKLLVSTMNMVLSDPATAHLTGRLVDYSQGTEFMPATQIAPETLLALMSGKEPMTAKA
ncbi:MAG: hypothetical protein M1423_09120 [Acidobacteria bacterium]|nr:hypothetical protein [Acidobacteriota bacterium]